MDDRTLLLLVGLLTTAGALTAFIVQYVRGRRGRGGRDPFDGPGDE